MPAIQKSSHSIALATTWGSLPPRVRALYVVSDAQQSIWLAEALASDSACQVLLEEAVGAAAALAAMREQIYDAVLVSHLPGQCDALEFVEGLRAGGAEEPVIIFGGENETDMAAVCYEVGADAYLSLHTATTRSFLWALARAIERHKLLADNQRLAQSQRNRSKHEQLEVERLLVQQREMLRREDCPGATQGPPVLPEALNKHYRELLRAHVMMGSGNLSQELASLAAVLSTAGVSSQQTVQLHLDALEELLRGLGSRGARHVMMRADLLILELLVGLAEHYRRA